MQVLYLSRYKLWQYFDFQHLGRGASSAIFNTWHSSNQIINSPSVWLLMHHGNPQTLAVMCEIPLQILWGGGDHDGVCTTVLRWDQQGMVAVTFACNL